jgi:hypothetical protein
VYEIKIYIDGSFEANPKFRGPKRDGKKGIWGVSTHLSARSVVAVSAWLVAGSSAGSWLGEGLDVVMRER